MVVLLVSSGARAVSGPLRLTIVLENPDYGTLAVDHTGIAYGKATSSSDPTKPYRLYRSGDEGRTWTPLYDFPSGSNVKYMTVLSDDTLIAHVDWGPTFLYRSGDGGRSWTQVLQFPDLYRTLSAHSITDDGSYVYLASYNNLDSGEHTNYVWRSADDGRTWTVVHQSTNHRHAHYAQVDPYTGDLYVGYGDQGAQVAIERSSDHGASWDVVCAGDACTSVDIAFDPSGYAIFGQDHVWSAASIMKLDLDTETLTKVGDLPGPSYSSLNLGGGRWLVGETHEPDGSVFDPSDQHVHLLGSADGGATFTDVYQVPYGDPTGYVRLVVEYTYPNGDFPIQVSGYGTVVANAGGSPPPPPSSVPVATGLPVVSGTAQVGLVLAASSGSWSGSPSSYGYEWLSCDSGGNNCSPISGAAASSYAPVAGDVGHALRVAVTATNGAGASVPAVSAATAAVGAAPPAAARLGQSAVGGLIDMGGAGYLDLSGPYTLAQAGTVSKLSGYVAGGSAGSRLRAVIYTSSGGQPAGLVAVSPEVAVAAGRAAGWLDFGFLSPVSLPAGSYWLGYWYADANSRHYYVDLAGAERYRAAAYSSTGSPPASFGTAKASTSSYSLYATISTSGPSVPVNTGLPAVSGSAQVGQTLTASAGSWSGSPSSYGYQWQSCDSGGAGCSAIGGATTSSYTPVSGDLGHALRVAVTATNSAGSSTPAVSAATSPIAAAPAPPVNTGLPAVSGSAQVGQTLTASAGSWSGSPSSYGYQWQSCDSGGAGCSAIGGATTSSYTPVSGDLGHALRVAVTATNSAGSSAPAVSNPTAAVTAAAATLGQTTVGSLIDTGGAGYLDLSGPYTLAQAATVSKLSGYIAGGSSSSHMRAVIYTSSGGQPGSLVAVTTEAAIAAGRAAGWLDLAFASPVSLPAGSYWLGYWYADANNRHYYLDQTGAERYRTAAYSPTANPPTSFGTAKTSTSSYSLYATTTS